MLWHTLDMCYLIFTTTFIAAVLWLKYLHVIIWIYIWLLKWITLWARRKRVHVTGWRRKRQCKVQNTIRIERHCLTCTSSAQKARGTAAGKGEPVRRNTTSSTIDARVTLTRVELCQVHTRHYNTNQTVIHKKHTPCWFKCSNIRMWAKN